MRRPKTVGGETRTNKNTLGCSEEAECFDKNYCTERIIKLGLFDAIDTIDIPTWAQSVF